MASTLYIQMPPKSVAEATPDWSEHAFPFCLASGDRRPLQQGRQNFQDLRDLATSANQVVLYLASSDVSFFDIEVPPMPLQKLRNALPNLLEEQLLSDPSELLFVCNAPVNGRCNVAVVSRSWMETLLAAAKVLDARKLSAYPSSLGLSQEEGAVVASFEAVQGADEHYILSVKTEACFASGIPVFCGSEKFNEAQAAKTLNSLDLFCAGKKVQFFVENQIQAIFAHAVGDNPLLELHSIDWSRKIAADLPPTLNLFSLLVQENQASFDWNRWRWPVILVSSILLVNILALNWEWYRLKTEASSLNRSLISTYKNLFPNESSIRDPLLQLQQKINQSKRAAGQSTEEDFLVMSGQLAQAWQTAHPQGQVLMSLEYKDRTLFVKPKNSNEVQIDPLRSALREHGLKIDLKEGTYLVSRDDGSKK